MNKKLSAMRLCSGRAWLCAIVVAFALMPDVGQAQHAHPPVRNAAPTVGSPAIPFELRTLDGKAISLGSFGGKPLVINFFATWCDPCREEMPLTNDLEVQAATNDYSILAVAVEDSRAAVTQYAKESKLVFPIALDLNSTVKRAYRIFGRRQRFLLTAGASSATSSSARLHGNGHRQRLQMPVYENDRFLRRMLQVTALSGLASC